jgi:DNA-binding NarL/FixJ family response regulator
MSEPANNPISVWLIEDNAAFRQSVSRAINRNPDLKCTGDFAACEPALAALDREKPDVVLIDVGLPGMTGIEGIPQIKAKSPLTQVVVLTVFEDHDKIFNAICAGASGYLLKGSAVNEIASSIREVARGGAPMSPPVARRVLGMFSKFTPSKGDYGLTEREKQMLEFMTLGITMKEMADKANVSYHTVDSHLRNIYAKLHVNSRAGAVAKALKEGLV